MDLEDFYAANESRRESAEFEYGDQWTDTSGNHYELSWVEATGELYLMIEPGSVITEDAFGDWRVSPIEVSELTIHVIGTIATHDEVEQRLQGWGDVVDTPNSLAWLHQRFADA